MHQGLNYITMRDGIELAATVRYPYGETCSAASPCPTVMEYSGYNVAGPTDPIPSLVDGVLGVSCTTCGNPNLLPDSATDVGAVVARFAGFATVSLQMRGTGCSGGAFDLFGYPSDYDAYDAVQIIAHQPWVANHKIGMVGISYSGLSQFPAAGTDPPGLAAIAPMSPTDDLFSTGYPGGIYNNGFAAGWINSRIDDAKAAAVYRGGTIAQSSTTPISGVGQPWTYYEIDAELAADPAGTPSACLANQALHDQSEDLAGLVGPQQVAPGTGAGRDPSLFDRRSMTDWASQVRVPVFVSGALQDEQTGPQWPALIDALPKTTPVFANMVNGGHIDSADPQTISRWLEFLDIYVADEVPTQPSGLEALVLGRVRRPRRRGLGRGAAPTHPVHERARRRHGARRVRRPDAARARALRQRRRCRRSRRHRVDLQRGLLQLAPRRHGHDPVLRPGRVAAAAAAGDAGQRHPHLGPQRPAHDEPAAGRERLGRQSGLGLDDGPGRGRDRLPDEPVHVADHHRGAGHARSVGEAAAPVEDFQATITEVRPTDGQEEYVTSGFLRSSNQVDAPNSTALFTNPTYLGAEASNLSPDHYTLVKIPIDPIAHTFRPGTELRVVISAPGGDRPVWTFDTLDNGQQATVGLGGAAPSSLTFNVVPGVAATPTLPTCGTLRGEPCRAYVPEGN